VLEGVKIVGLSVLAACVYGVVHDQITARMCLEYFTVAHPDVAGHEPTRIALYWGVVATWWVGLPLGVAVAVASRAGDRVPATARHAAPRIAMLLVVLFVLAMSAGAVGWAAYTPSDPWIGSRWGDRIPEAHRAGFAFDACAHAVSYVGGAIGGLVVAARTFLARARKATSDPREAWAWAGCGLLALSAIVGTCTLATAINVEEQQSSPSPASMGPVLYASYLAFPGLPILLGVLGLSLLIAKRVASPRASR
jgi:hypothetical protein